jgi:hypothetical protein
MLKQHIVHYLNKSGDLSVLETSDNCLVSYQENRKHRLDTLEPNNVPLLSLQVFHFGNHNTEVEKITHNRHTCRKCTEDALNEDNSLS